MSEQPLMCLCGHAIEKHTGAMEPELYPFSCESCDCEEFIEDVTEALF